MKRMFEVAKVSGGVALVIMHGKTAMVVWFSVLGACMFGRTAPLESCCKG
jgi:hypothetical protein